MTGKTNTSKARLTPIEKAMKILAIAVEKASDKITDAADNAIIKVSKAADVASDKLAVDAIRATDVVVNNAATALKVSGATENMDHDLLIKLEVSLKHVSDTLLLVKSELKEDIKDIKDGTALKIETNRVNIEAISTKMPGLCTDVNDLKKVVYDTLEIRFRKIENKVSNYLITISVAGVGMMAMIGLIIYHILHTS